MYNNYGYNPYYQPPRVEPSVQPQYMQNMTPKPYSPLGLNGKSVDSIEVVRATDIPLDGSVCYFPLTDGSAIITKQLMMDGTSKTVIYRPVENENEPAKQFITVEQLKEGLNSIDLSEIDELKEEFREFRKEFKELKQRIKNKGD